MIDMKEIGGYIELDTFTGPMLHGDGIKLNCGRNALAYLIEAKKIKKLWMPKYMCDSCDKVLSDRGVAVEYYSIGLDFKPKGANPAEDEWLYVVNFYGQLSNGYLSSLKAQHPNLIVDNAQAYFQMPLPETDTMYTCRKFFGVADGAILYTDAVLDEEIPLDESFHRMRFLLGRYERPASEFYSEYTANNRSFADEPIKRMSRLTENLLHGIDYERVRQRRTENFAFLHERLHGINRLNLTIPEGAFMYPLYLENGAEIRKKLQAMKIYIPSLWPAVFDICNAGELEYNMANNILPLPIDQRYREEDMRKVVEKIIQRREKLL